MRRARAAWLALGYASGVWGCGANDEPALGSHQAALTLGSVRWEQRAVTLPPARMGHALIYDEARQVTLAVGGRPVDDTGDSRSDTWAWDGSSWSELQAGFPQRGFIEGVFDTTRQVSVIYGGIDRSPLSTYFAETQERGTDAWTNRSGTPGQRSSAGLAFDSARGVSVLFGGFDGDWLSDLREWNGSTWTQRCTSTPCTSARPSRRAGMTLTYDAARQRTLLFGGFESTLGDDYLGDTWTWDGSVWTQHTTPTAPSARASATAAYDPVTRLVYLYGGTTGSGELGDLWAWDGSAWQLVASEGGPSARRDARLVWDTERRRGVLFGGRDDSQAVDFWELSLVGNECTTSESCHTGVCDGSLCVDETDAPDSGAAPGGSGGSGGSGGPRPRSSASSRSCPRCSTRR